MLPEDSGKKRADERTQTADLISLRVISHVLLGVAQACKPRMSRTFFSLVCCELHRIAFPVVSKVVSIASSYSHNAIVHL